MKKALFSINQPAVIICAAIVFLLALNFCISLHQVHKLPNCYVQITEVIRDNDYNNYISKYDSVGTSGNLIRIGDKLYVNYYGSYASYGLYEVSSDGVHRIHWDGHGPWAFLSGYSYKLYPIRKYKGKLLMNSLTSGNHYVYNHDKTWELAQGKIAFYCEDTRSFEEVSLPSNITNIHSLTYQETSFGFVYESADMQSLWVYSKDGEAELISDKGICSFYTIGAQIYYLSKAKPDSHYTLHMFDYTTKLDSIVCEWYDYKNISYFIIEENVLVFAALDSAQNTQAIYTLDLTNTERGETPIYTNDKSSSDVSCIYSWNVCDNTIYLCTHKGLISIDLLTGTQTLLCEIIALECDILDDTWVYFFEKEKHRLWRVNHKGGDPQLVLG